MSTDYDKLKLQLEERTQALQDCEARFRNIITRSADGIVIINHRGCICFVNPAAEALFRRKADELLDKQFEFPVIAGKMTELDIGQQGGKKTTVEMQLVETEWEGAPAHLATLRDITERKENERELRKLHRAVTESPSMVMITDRRGIIEYVNPKFSEVSGYTFAEAVGKNPRFLKSGVVPPETYAELWKTITRGGAWRGEMINRKKNGELYWESASIAPITDFEGNIINFISVTEDITERKRLEAELEHIASIPQLNPNPILELDVTGKTTFYNRAAKEILQKVGKSDSDNPFKPHDLQEILRDLKERKALQYSRKVEIDGMMFDENIYLAPQFNAVRIYAMEITERVRAEEKIEILNTNLAARASDLEAANRELESFGYSVTHDLRKPLTIINGYCQVLRELCADKLDEQCKSYIEEAYNGTLRMSDLIDALLRFSMLASKELRREEVDLSGVARSAAGELRLAEPERPVTLKIAEGIKVNGDADLLKIVLDNLLGNAWKYTKNRQDAVIEFGAAETADETVFFVRDNGIGFNMADAEKMFAPFQRLTVPAEYKGHGIGLATVHRIIQRHGGRIWAEGEPGKGAVFYFTLGGDRT